MADTFGAFFWVNFVDVRPHVNRIIGAFRFTDITVDALIGNDQGQDCAALKTNLFGDFGAAVLRPLDDHHRHTGSVQNFVGNRAQQRAA